MSKRNEINGIKIIDATSPIRIHISSRDTKLGKTKDPGACAAARCCTRTVDECSAARIHIGCAYLKMHLPKIGVRWVRYKTSPSLRTEIIAFDRGASFEPGVYTLSAISPSQRRGKRHSGSNTNRNKPGKSHRPLTVRHTVTNVRPHGANR